MSERRGLYPAQCRDTEPLHLETLPSWPEVPAHVSLISFICPWPVNSEAVTTVPRMDDGEMWDEVEEAICGSHTLQSLGSNLVVPPLPSPILPLGLLSSLPSF